MVTPQAPAPAASKVAVGTCRRVGLRSGGRWWYVCGARATAGGGVTRPALQPRTVTFLRRKSLRREETRRAVLHFFLRPGLLHLCIFCSRNGAPSELRSCSLRIICRLQRWPDRYQRRSLFVFPLITICRNIKCYFESHILECKYFS